MKYKSKSIPFAVAFCMIAVVSVFTPRTVLASLMYEYEYQFIGASGGEVMGTFVVNDYVGILDESNLIEISVESPTGIGGSAPFVINAVDVVNPDFEFNADTEVIGVLAVEDGSGPVNNFACGPGPNTSCDMQVQTQTTLYFENGDQQTVSAVPEPTTLALFGIGLAGLGFARKKKKSA